MKIKLSTPLAGTNYAHRPGDVIEVSAAEGARHLANGNGVEHVESTSIPDGLMTLNEARRIIAAEGAESAALGAGEHAKPPGAQTQTPPPPETPEQKKARAKAENDAKKAAAAAAEAAAKNTPPQA